MKGRRNKQPIPYVSFTTFVAVLDRLKGTRLGDTLIRERCGVRNKSSWDQLCGSFRALQLLDRDDRPTAALKRLIGRKRKSELLKILKQYYPEVFEADLNRIGRARLEQILNLKYGVAGTTKVRARSFLLGALLYCEENVSLELSRMTRLRWEKKQRLQVHASNSGKDRILSHTEHDVTLTVAIRPGSWPEIELFEHELITRLFDELLSIKKRTTKPKRPHLTSVKS